MKSAAKKGRKDQAVRRILFSVGDSRHVRLVLDGLYRYALDRPDWLIISEVISPRAFQRMACDVMIGVFESRASAQPYRRRGIPLISLLRTPVGIKMPSIRVDQEAVGRMAADYFHKLGIQQAAFAGYPRIPSDMAERGAARENPVVAGRQRGFEKALAKAGITFFKAPDLIPWSDTSRRETADWLMSLPKPVGLFCVADTVSRLYSGFCRMEGLAVPGQVALLGVDNEADICDMVTPALSSIAIPWEQIGEDLGHMLDSLFSSGRLSDRPRRVEPTGVVERASSRLARAGDPDVALAVERLYERACNPGNLKEIFADFSLSYRHLRRRFHQVTGRTLLAELWRIRVDRAQILLRSTSRSLADIAAASGFADRRQMVRVFDRITGKSPQAFRS